MQPSDPLASYLIPASPEDSFIYNSEIFIDVPPALFSSILNYMIPVKTATRTYLLNVRYLYLPKNYINPTILYLHGHGSSCTWATWLKLAFSLFEDGFNGVLIDLPGYGKSSIEGETRVNPKLYMNDSANMLATFLDTIFLAKAKEANKKVIGVGFCGGAANLVRAISDFPDRFAKRHILHNCVIGQIPENFELTLGKSHMKVWVSWRVDEDHTKGCVGYKFFHKKRKEGSSTVFLQDIKEEELRSNGMWSRNMGRKTSNVMIFDPSEGYIQFASEFLRGSTGKIPVYQVIVKKGETLQKVIDFSPTENEEIDKDLELALKLSLNDR